MISNIIFILEINMENGFYKRQQDKQERKQNQHYVPKFLLNKFIVPGGSWYWNGEKLQKRNSEKIFSENNIYGEFNSFLEKEFSKQEENGSKIFSKIINAKNELILTREEREKVSELWAFLPRRTKSMEKTLKKIHNNKKLTLIDSLNNDFKNKGFVMEPILHYTMTIWETETELPLFPELMGMNENAGITNIEKVNDPLKTQDDIPDTMFFPISSNKIVILFNQKWRFDRILFQSNLEKSFNENNDLDVMVRKSQEYIQKNYLEKSIFLKFNFIKFNYSAPIPNYKNEKNNNIKSLIELRNIPKSEKDTFKYRIQKLDYSFMKYYVTEMIIGTRLNGFKDVIFNNKNYFITLLKDIKNDLESNLTFNKDKYTYDDWYNYAMYKLSREETIGYVKEYIEDILKFT